MKKLLKLENLIYLTVIGLPLYMVKFHIGEFSINVLDIMQIAIFMWWIIDKKNSKEKFKTIFTKYKIFVVSIALILLGLAISIIINGDYPSGLGIAKSWFVLPILFVFVGINILDERGIKNIFQAYFYSAFGVSFLALTYFFFGSLTFDGRLEGIFNSPNYLAMYLAPAIIIGITLFKEKKKIYASSLAVILLAFYLTLSYAAWIFLFLAIAVSLILTNRENKKFLIYAFLVLFTFLSLQVGKGKLNNLLLQSERSSFISRTMIWKSAERIYKDNPLWGIGPSKFQEKYLEYQKFYPPYLEWAVSHPHNIFLAFLLQTGILGFSGFLLLLASWFKEIFKVENNSMKLIVLGIVIYIILHGLVDTTYFKNDLAVVFWINFLVLKKTREGLI